MSFYDGSYNVHVGYAKLDLYTDQGKIRRVCPFSFIYYVSVFLYFLVLSIAICLLFLWAMPPESK